MSNLSVSESRVKIGATPSDHVINLAGGVTRVTVDTSIKNYANPNTLELTLASLRVDSEGNTNTIEDLSSQNLVDTTYVYDSGFTLPQPIINIQRVNSFKNYSNSAISGLITRIQSVSNISDYELDGAIALTNTRSIVSDVSGGGGGSEPVSSGPIQTWY